MPATRPATTAIAVVAVLVLVAGLWTLRSFDPNAAGSLFPPCLFRVVTGWYCPGCGITRALHALAHFDPMRALAMNPLVVASLPVLAAMVLHGLQRPVLPPAWARVLFDGRWWIAALVLFGVLRNLPWFAWLAPGGML